MLPALVAKYQPSKVLVFGSRARGDALQRSNLDVLIISEALSPIRWRDSAVRVVEDCDIRSGWSCCVTRPRSTHASREELGSCGRTLPRVWSWLSCQVALSASRPPFLRVFVPERDTTERTNYVQLFGAIAPIIASTIASTVVVKK